ncbi:nucleotidyltransferase [Crassaminicella indica]|uniref:tRNA(Met) cytidine acetate ligase n=1 Tax=Crassaminicella indica TaxID=2855394 RepID=A0ABX8R9Z9_9CLOT|nr:nucleotidyltransferase [Crassaminicella indica]QXM05880.1 nucleotidyltransferase [Crassaminicella indica]
MKVLGFITEYNPFHNGHKYHLKKSIKKVGATHTVAVMSGNFLQRGVPALTNKWIRAEMAVKEGVDLVIELPVVYACNSAELFAYGGISLLNSLGIIDTISFGSEIGDIHKLKKISKILSDEPALYKNYLKEFLSKGISFPHAREKALGKYCLDQSLEEVLHSPNNILAIEYIKALIKCNSKINPSTITRIKAHYNETDINSNICSATAIRTFLTKKNYDVYQLKKVIPKNSFEVFVKSIKNGFAPIDYNHFEKMILYKLRTVSKLELRKVFDVNEGLENRIKATSLNAINLQSLIQMLKTKRYTYTRLQRIFIHTLLGITNQHIQNYNKVGGSQYARILAFSSKGTEILKRLKKTSQIPILTNINKQILKHPIAKEMLSFDILASDIYSLAYPNEQHRIGGSDYYNKPYSFL